MERHPPVFDDSVFKPRRQDEGLRPCSRGCDGSLCTISKPRDKLFLGVVIEAFDRLIGKPVPVLRLAHNHPTPAHVQPMSQILEGIPVSQDSRV